VEDVDVETIVGEAAVYSIMDVAGVRLEATVDLLAQEEVARRISCCGLPGRLAGSRYRRAEFRSDALPEARHRSHPVTAR
jgi:hypothetical protein